MFVIDLRRLHFSRFPVKIKKAPFAETNRGWGFFIGGFQSFINPA
jgi:hypothetical protein